MNDTAVLEILKQAAQAQRAGKLGEAEALYRQALVLKPDYAPAQFGLGTLAQQLGRHDVAVDLLGRAIDIDNGVAEYHLNLGIAYKELNRFEEAIACFQQILALSPTHAQTYFQLGLVYSLQGKFTDSIASQLSALAIDPYLSEAHNNLGYSYLSLGRLSEAVASFQRAVANKPDYAKAHYNLAVALSAQGNLEQASACFQKALTIQPNLVAAHNNYLLSLQYRARCSPPEMLTIAQRYADQFENPLKLSWLRHENSSDPDRRLKIGYVSPDFHYHAVTRFIVPILAHHDKAQVEVYGYYSNTLHDAVTDQIRGYADHWIPCKGLTDEHLAGRIRADEIDLLVDLAGHTEGNRLLTFARKPAPVQVSYLGYPATTGLSAMDYRLVTWDTDPAGAERWHTERLYRLPRSLWCYRPEAGLPAVAAETPARRSGTITFGSMNNLAKVSEATVATWSGLLKRVPGSRLVMTNIAPAAAAGVRERFARHGVEGERLRLEGRLETPAYRALLSQVDIALDPYPYNGTTTTCEVLWMGIPVVTLTGETSVARSGYALLKMIGLTELAAPDETGYVAIAAGLATDLDRLETLRRGLRARMEASPLRDEAGLTREIEAAYRAMWKGWCAQGATA